MWFLEGRIEEKLLADIVSRTTRSRIMAAVRQKDTAPEMRVRRLLHGIGYRYRLHDRNLPGKPDVVFSARRKVIFVNGCFWHGHKCRKGRIPKSNVEFWRAKITRNRARDAEAIGELRSEGWSVRIVWQCELRDEGSLKGRLVGFLESNGR